MFWISYRVSEKNKWIDTPYWAGVGLITTKDEALLLIADYLFYIIWKKAFMLAVIVFSLRPVWSGIALT